MDFRYGQRIFLFETFRQPLEPTQSDKKWTAGYCRRCVKLTTPTHKAVTRLRMSATVLFFPRRSYLDIIPISPSSRPARYVNRGSNRSVTLNCRDVSQVRPASCVECCMGHWFQFVPWVVSVWDSDSMTNETPSMSGSCVASLFYKCNPAWGTCFMKRATCRMSGRVYLCGALVSPHQPSLCH